MITNKKSEKLTSEEKRKLRVWVSKQPTKKSAAVQLGIARNTLHLIMASGSCHPDTADRIRAAINNKMQAA